MMEIRRICGWLAQLFGLLKRKRREHEFAEELESHLAMHIEDNLRAGMSPEEARRQALIKLGGVTLTQELYREQGGLPMLETFWQDLRYGARMWIGHAQSLPGSPPRTIIGVIGDMLLNNLNSTPNAAAWVPISQQGSSELTWRNLYLVAHTTDEPQSMLAAIRKQIATVDADLALADIATMEERLGKSLWRQRFTASVLSAFSLIALAIAALGVFGVTSYLVGQRMHEIGVRVALGALPGDIFRLVLKEGILSTLIGIAFGVAGSLTLTRFLENLLYGVSAKDPFTLAASAILLALVSLAACSIPARRAAKIDPLIALKTE
jgi:hypothetical protein